MHGSSGDCALSNLREQSSHGRPRGNGRTSAVQQVAQRRLETCRQPGVAASGLIEETLNHDIKRTNDLVRFETCDQRPAERPRHRIRELVDASALAGRYSMPATRSGEDVVTPSLATRYLHAAQIGAKGSS